ncbi:unnamed protein product [Trichogramma brassicae]|uniref:Uncharacterized protein n=1 Tax=Trichogramma brassicae TaxID=86971 RepID=A0A6H5HX34_9HYME|nr:unnamed protein product [Trichogramma brassicae]
MKVLKNELIELKLMHLSMLPAKPALGHFGKKTDIRLLSALRKKETEIRCQKPSISRSKNNVKKYRRDQKEEDFNLEGLINFSAFSHQHHQITEEPPGQRVDRSRFAGDLNPVNGVGNPERRYRAQTTPPDAPHPPRSCKLLNTENNNTTSQHSTFTRHWAKLRRGSLPIDNEHLAYNYIMMVMGRISDSTSIVNHQSYPCFRYSSPDRLDPRQSCKWNARSLSTECLTAWSAGFPASTWWVY